MKIIVTLITGVLAVSILSIALGGIQSGLSEDYSTVSYNAEDYKFSNATNKTTEIAEDLQTEIETATTGGAGVTDRASAILGATMDSGKLIVSTPYIIISFLSTFSDRVPGIPISNTILPIIVSGVFVVVIFAVLMWRRGIAS